MDFASFGLAGRARPSSPPRPPWPPSRAPAGDLVRAPPLRAHRARAGAHDGRAGGAQRYGSEVWTNVTPLRAATLRRLDWVVSDCHNTAAYLFDHDLAGAIADSGALGLRRRGALLAGRSRRRARALRRPGERRHHRAHAGPHGERHRVQGLRSPGGDSPASPATSPCARHRGRRRATRRHQARTANGARGARLLHGLGARAGSPRCSTARATPSRWSPPPDTARAKASR